MALQWYVRPRSVVLKPTSSVLDAARAIEQNRIGAVVVQHQGRVVGIVTDRDLAVRALGRGLDARTTKIEEIMTPSPLTLTPADTPEDAIRLMQRANVRRIPLAEGERVVGMVTLDDLLLDESAPLGDRAGTARRRRSGAVRPLAGPAAQPRARGRDARAPRQQGARRGGASVRRAGEVREVLGKGILGLLGKRNAVNEERYAGDRVGLEESLDKRGCRPGFAGTGGHLDEHLAPAGVDLAAQRVDAIRLVVALDDVAVDGDSQRVARHFQGGGTALKVGLREERLDGAGERLAGVIPEADFLAIGEKDIRNAELLGIGAALRFRLAGIDRRLLGLDDSKGAAVPITKDVIRARAVPANYLVTDGIGVLHLPSLVGELGVDLEAATKLLYLALRNVTAKWKKAAREWKAALSEFAILFEDRFAAVGM